MSNNDLWWFMKAGDDDNLYCEDGSVRPLQASDYHLTFGKYSGLTLDEVTDEWYLAFLGKLAAEKPDWYLARCLALKKK